MEIRPLMHLTAVVEHGNFGAASRALGISQPALTKSIQKLERDLGVTLLNRSRRGISPTAIGRHVVEGAKGLVQRASELRREVDLLRGVEIGSFEVGIGPGMSETFVTDAIARLAEKVPQARIRVRVDHWTQLSQWLLAGQLDLYVADVTEAVDDDRLKIVRMPVERLVWFCRAGHPLASARRLTPADLLTYPIASPRLPPWARSWFATHAAQKTNNGREIPYNTVECENYAMLKRMVLQSNCISAALHSTIAREIQDGTIVVLPIKAPTLKTAAGIVQLKGRMLSPIGEAFVQDVLLTAKQVALQRQKSVRN